MTMNFPARKARRIVWEAARERIDLAAVAADLLGAAPGRRGERGRRLWWSCPLGNHPDRNPSFTVDPGRGRWRCYGCGEHGDAAALVMRLRHVPFPEAAAILSGNLALQGSTRRTGAGPSAPYFAKGKNEAAPSGVAESDALALVEAASVRLWTPEGAKALAYLTGPERCLSTATIRAARLGWTPRAEGVAWRPPAVVIPWFFGGRLAMVKVRPADDWRGRFPGSRRPPKYLEAFRDPTRLLCYPGPEVVRSGRPVIVAEGELDALCLGEAVDEGASVVTLGGASARPTRALLDRFPADPAWYIATDRDEAGDHAAAAWPARSRRVRPPGPFKDWTEARAGGVDLARWWRDILAGTDSPPPSPRPEPASRTGPR